MSAERQQNLWSCETFSLFFFRSALFFAAFCSDFALVYSIASYLYVSCSGSITSVREERANLSAIVYL